MPISGDRPAHRGTLVAFWSWWWGYPLSFAFLFAFCPQAQKVWGVQLCRWAPHVPMPTSYADLIWYWGGWLSLHRVIRWFICSETPSYKEFGAKGWFYTLWTVCVLAYDTLYTITHDYEHRWCFNIVLCVDNRGGSVNATDPWATQHDGFFRMARPSHGYEELYEPECWLCRCNIHQSLCANIYFSRFIFFCISHRAKRQDLWNAKKLGRMLRSELMHHLQGDRKGNLGSCEAVTFVVLLGWWKFDVYIMMSWGGKSKVSVLDIFTWTHHLSSS